MARIEITITRYEKIDPKQQRSLENFCYELELMRWERMGAMQGKSTSTSSVVRQILNSAPKVED